MCFTSYIFLIKICWNSFFSSSYDFITSSHIIAESSIILAKYFTFSKIHVVGFYTYFLLDIWCFLHSHQHLSLFHHWFELHFVPSSLHLHLHHICFVNVFDSFIPVIMLKTLRFKSSVLFGTHALLDKSLIVLQLPAHLSN